MVAEARTGALARAGGGALGGGMAFVPTAGIRSVADSVEAA